MTLDTPFEVFTVIRKIVTSTSDLRKILTLSLLESSPCDLQLFFFDPIRQRSRRPSFSHHKFNYGVANSQTILSQNISPTTTISHLFPHFHRPTREVTPLFSSLLSFSFLFSSPWQRSSNRRPHMQNQTWQSDSRSSPSQHTSFSRGSMTGNPSNHLLLSF